MKKRFYVTPLACILLSSCSHFPEKKSFELGKDMPPSRYYGSDSNWHYFEEGLARMSLFPMPQSWYHERYKISRDLISVAPETSRVWKVNKARSHKEFQLSQTP